MSIGGILNIANIHNRAPIPQKIEATIEKSRNVTTAL